MKRDDYISLGVALAGPMLGGQLMGLLCAKDVLGRWYNKLLKRPKWNPPNWLFGTVWPALYVAQSVASWIVWKDKGADRKLPLGLYAAQLVFNLAWQPLFFKLHRPDIALADSAVMLGLAAAAGVTMTQAVGDHRSKVAVASLMTPYVAWVAFATVLTAKIWKDNPNAAELERDEPTKPDAPPASAPTTKPFPQPTKAKTPASPPSAQRKPEEVIKSAGAAMLEKQKAEGAAA